MAKHRFKPCARCGRRARTLHAMRDWNVVVEFGVITSLICDRCQTDAENAEAVIHEATLDYGMVGGRIAGVPKGSM